MDNLLSPQASQNKKPRDNFKPDEPTVSCADLRSQVIKNTDDIPPGSSVNHRKQLGERKATKKEELVKYMSNVPTYLGKGENHKEKALTVGVLDWRRLEKWQHNHKPTSHQSRGCSPSSSNSSSFFSTDESSTHSSRGHSSSPARQRMHRPSLHSNLNVSTKEGHHSQGVKTTVVENVGKFEDLRAASSNPLKGQQSVFRMYQSFSKNQSEIKLKEPKRKDIIPKVETSYGAASRSKGKTKIQEGESTSELKKCQDSCSDVHRSYHQEGKTIVLPRDDAESSHSAEANRRSISKRSFSKEFYSADRYSEVPHSCPLPREDDNIKDSPIKQTRSSFDAKSSKFSSEPSRPSPYYVKMSNSMPQNSTAIKSSEGSDLKKGTTEASKLRNSSPTRRFINGLGRIGRISISKDSSQHVPAKCESDKPVAASCLEDSNNDKPNGKTRSQSPLRRLLDPLLKPKAENHFSDSSQKDPTAVDRVSKSSLGRVESSTVHPLKGKLDFSSCKTVSIDDSHQKKHGLSTVQALLQILIKNGIPRFTFAVDNNSDILAATMRKDEKCWVYTFFTVHEVKKKNGWINQGGKGKSRDYVPNAVAQMRVSDSQFSNLARHSSVEELSIREFVLSELKQADQPTSDLDMNDELAAIVVKIPKDIASLNENGKHREKFKDPSVIGLGEPLPPVRKYPTPKENQVNGSSVQSQDLLSTTVVLPGGVHGFPRKGEPSPLIERWKSGGLCDCGGWDLGCRLRVLANQNKLGRRSTLAKTHNAAERFELFSQGEVVDDTPVFSLSPFKDGIFSVEFNSSLSFLQAFSICIAVLNSRKPYDLSELSKLFEEKSSEETAFGVNDGRKAPNQVQEEVQASYASYPPISPIGRL